MKKLTTWKLLIVLLAMLVSVSGTIAYLTDSDGDVNVMTLGRVEIDLIEQERTANGLDIFHDDKPLIPGVYPDSVVTGKETTFWPDTVHNPVDKIVSITNTGNSDAYVRLWFAFEVTGEKDFFQNKIHLNCNDQDWTWNFIDSTLEHGGDHFVVATATYKQKLLPGQSTEESLRQVLLDASATNEDLAALGEKYSILVVAQGVQAQGFSTSAQALDAGFGAVTLANHPFTGMETGETFVTVTAKGLQKVLNNVQMGGKQAVTGVTFGRMSEYGHVVDPQSSQPVDEQTSTGILPMLFTTAYADDNGDVVAYYVPTGTDKSGKEQYHVYILSEGAIKLPKDCEELMGEFGNLAIFTATNLDASDVKQMQNFFKGCTNLRVVKVPEGTTVIPEEMFAGCENLESIDLPGTVTEINPQAFKDHKEDVYLIVVPGSYAETWGKEEEYKTTNWPFIWHNMGDYIHIEKYIGTDAEVVVPAEIDGQPVEVLGANAFAAMEHMDIVVSVQLPDTLRRMDYGVFIDCGKLKSITIPGSVSRVGNDCFALCKSLTTAVIGEGVTKLESGVFAGCDNLTSVTLPSTLTYLGNDVFKDCYNLQSLTLPSRLTHIGSDAFCAVPATITLPKSLTWLGTGALNDCRNIRVYSGTLAQDFCEDYGIPYTLVNGGTMQPQNPKPTPVPDANPSDADNYKTQERDGYIYIDRYEDNGTPATQITVPGWLDGLPVRVIGTSAFASKKFLQSVTLPEGLWEINPTAFTSCERLTYVYIPDSVNNIGRDAFSYCGQLQSIRLPAGISSINDSTFAGCHALSEITVPSNVLHIEREAFANCFSLQTVTLNEGLQTLAAKVFSNCSNLRSITIPKSVTSIGSGVFDGCHLVQVTVYQNTAGHDYVVANGIPFRLLDKNGNVLAEPVATPTPTPGPEITPDPGNNDGKQWFGPTDEIPFTWYKTADYAAVTQYEGMGPDVVVPAELGGVPVRVLGLNAFARMEYVKTVQLPETLTTIEGWIFPDCPYLTTCNIPAGVTYIGEGAFNGCNSLQSLTIPKGLTEILDYTFGWCEALTTVTIPGNVKSIGSMAFSDCHGLTEVIIEDGVQTIGDQAFSGDGNLTSIVIPSSVTKIGANIFMYCPYVQVTVYEKNTAYDYCKKNGIAYKLLDANGNVVEEVKPDVPDDGGGNGGGDSGNTGVPGDDGATYFAPTSEIPFTWRMWGTFSAELVKYEEEYNDHKTYIELPAYLNGLPVQTLQPELFSGSSSLERVVVPETVGWVCERAFAGCPSLTSVTFLNPNVTFDARAAEGCSDKLVVYGPDGNPLSTWPN